MTPDFSLLLAHYASEGSACERDAQSGNVLSPDVARVAAQIALLTAEERRLLALGAEVREVALTLGQQRFETWEQENPKEVAAFRAAVGRGAGEGYSAQASRNLWAAGEPVRLS